MKNTILKIFNEIYGERDDVRVFFSPGRVNLIGEYTDFIYEPKYNYFKEV